MRTDYHTEKSCENTARRWPSASQEELKTKTKTKPADLHLGLYLLSCQKIHLFKPPSLWYFVVWQPWQYITLNKYYST